MDLWSFIWAVSGPHSKIPHVIQRAMVDEAIRNRRALEQIEELIKNGVATGRITPEEEALLKSVKTPNPPA